MKTHYGNMVIKATSFLSLQEHCVKIFNSNAKQWDKRCYLKAMMVNTLILQKEVNKSRMKVEKTIIVILQKCIFIDRFTF